MANITLPYKTHIGPLGNSVNRLAEPQEKTFPLAVLDFRNRLPSPIHPRYTTGSSRMMLNRGKSAADFQRVVSGIGDIAGTPDTAWDRRLTRVYWASPERRRRFARLSVLGRVDRQ